MPFVKKLPAASYYAVIFISEKKEVLDGYAEMDDKTLELAHEQPGFLGYESVGNGPRGIFISYWESMEAIQGWRQNATHMMAKSQAARWYKKYLSQICKVEHTSIHESNSHS